MTRSEQNTSLAILSILAIVDFVYGLLFLLIPRWLFAFSQDPGVPANPGWVRWAGALLVGVGIAAWLATADIKTQKPLVIGLAVASGLIAVSLLYSIFLGEYAGAQWFLWLPIAINTVFAVALAWVATKQP